MNDLDVIWELPLTLLQEAMDPKVMAKSIDARELDVSRLLADLASRLEEECRHLPIAVRIKAQSHSVGINFGAKDEEFSIDLVPAIPVGDVNEFGDSIYMVPETAFVKKLVRRLIYESHATISWLKI